MKYLIRKLENPFLRDKKNHNEILLYFNLIKEFNHPIDITELTPSFFSFLTVALELKEAQTPKNGNGKGNKARALRRQ